jgi:hypothetical protein
MNRIIISTIAAVVIGTLGIECQTLAQSAASDSSSNPTPKNKANKAKDVSRTSKSTPDGEIEPYSYEVSSRLLFNTKKGTVKPAGDAAETKLSQNEIGASVMIGSLLTEHIEPFFEFSYLSVKRDVADYTSKDSVLDIGLGLLVNLPQVEKSKVDKEDAGPDMMAAKWVPCIGILVGNSKTTDDSSFGADGVAKVSDGNSYTKLIVGTRWFVYPHISVNFDVRILYEKSTTSAESTSTHGADRSRVQVDITALAMSLFI